MDKLYIFSIILGTVFAANSAFATVGGPTYISEIAFDTAGNSIYYKVHDGGGRGCPPIIHKINFTTGEHYQVKTCDQVEQEFPYSEENTQKYNQFMADTYQNLSYLGSVSLEKNNIDVQVEFLSENKLEGSDDWVISSNFRATIAQDGKEISKIDFKGCAKDQPHIFEGYMIPSEDRMAMLISNKGDCFEGGYVREGLSIIKGVKYYDKNIIRGFKEASATEPNVGNMVVYAGTIQSPQPGTTVPENTTAESNNKALYIIVIVVGLGLGYFFGRKR